MKTNQITPTYSIALTEILVDPNDSTRLELVFAADLSHEYALTTEFAADDSDTLAENYESDDSIAYEFNIASRHNDSIYAIIQNDRSGDSFDSDSFIFTFGLPVYEFIANACRILNVPLN
jgi:hypothetical protein